MFTRRQDGRTEPMAEIAVTNGSGSDVTLDTAASTVVPRTMPPPLGSQTTAGAAPGAATAAGSSKAAAESVIGQDLTIEGQSITIRCQGTLRINGSIDAELHSREIAVGNSGTVQGSITAERVDVWGQVSGAIRGARVLLHAGARVEGDIHAASLSIEDGASFDGRSRRATDAATVAPQLVAGAKLQSSEVGSAAPIPLPRTTVLPVSE